MKENTQEKLLVGSWQLKENEDTAAARKNQSQETNRVIKKRWEKGKVKEPGTNNQRKTREQSGRRTCSLHHVKSYKELTEDALALSAEEGRGTLRKAWGSCERAPIPGCPNGETRQSGPLSPLHEPIV